MKYAVHMQGAIYNFDKVLQNYSKKLSICGYV